MADVEAGPSSQPASNGRDRSKRRASRSSPSPVTEQRIGDNDNLDEQKPADGTALQRDGDVAGNGARDKTREEVDESDAAPSDPARQRVPSPQQQQQKEPPSKRARRGAGDADAAGRSRRLFGLLNQTLSKAKEDNARRTTGEAGRRRAEVEKRLQQKIKHDEVKMKQEKELTAQLERQLSEAFTLSIDMQSMEMAIRLRKAQKRRLGSFLVTPSELARCDGQAAEGHERGASQAVSVDGRVLAPDIATVIAPVTRAHPPVMQAPDAHPVYYLPAKMLPSQDDQLDAQEDQVDDAIDAADAAWDERKREMRTRLNALQEEIRTVRDALVKLEHGTPEAREASS